MRILVTGCAGFIGSRLCEWILRHQPGVEIVGIDNLSTGFRENVPHDIGRISFWPMTLGKPYTNSWDDSALPYIPEPNPRPFDYVFHCAAMAAECLSPFTRGRTYRDNIIGTASLLNFILNTQPRPKRFVFLSSIAVYGRARPPFKEVDQCIPQDPYGVSKLACEIDLRIAGEQHGLDWCSLRLFNVYGPGQSLWNRHRNVFGIWMRAKLEGKPLVVFGDGSQERAFTYIDDILPTIWNAAVNPAASRRVFNVGSAMPVSIAEALFECCDVIGEADVQYQPARHEVKSAYCDVSKAQAVLMMTERTPLRDGLQAMWEWAQVVWEKYPERNNQTGPPIELAISSSPAPRNQ